MKAITQMITTMERSVSTLVQVVFSDSHRKQENKFLILEYTRTDAGIFS